MKTLLACLNKRSTLLVIALLASALLVIICVRNWIAPAYDKDRAAAENTLAEADQLQKQWRLETHRKAIEKYEEARAYWKAISDWKEEAAVLREIGEAYNFLSERQKAIDVYNQALQLYQKANDRQGEGEILNQIGYVYLSWSKKQQASEFCGKALAISRDTGNRRGEADALNKIGEIYYFEGDLQKSVNHHQLAMPIWIALNDKLGQAKSLMLLGNAYLDLRETQNALDSFNQALEFWKSVDDRRQQALALVALGRLNSRTGEKQKALDFFNQAMHHIQLMGDRDLEGRALNGLGFIYDELGDKRLALRYYEQALKLYQIAGVRRGESSQLIKIGETHLELGDSQQALRTLQDALTIVRDLGDLRAEPYVLRDLGMVYESLKDKPTALRYYNQALQKIRAGKDRRQEAYLLNNLGLISGDKKKALSYFNQALPLNQVTGDRFGESLTLYNIAQAEYARNNLTAARLRLEDSLKIIESLRTKVASQELRTSYFSYIHQQYEFYVSLLMHIHQQRPAEGFDALALEASERMRARSLLELLTESRTNIRHGLSPQLLERERSLQQLLNDKAEQQVRLLNRKHTNEEAAAMANEIEELTAKYDQVKAQIRSESPNYAALTQPQPASLQEIQQLLDDDTVLLEYSLGSKSIYLWVVTRTGLKAYELPNRAEIENLSREVYDLLTPPESGPVQLEKTRNDLFWRQATKLSQKLLGGITAELGKKRLVIVADGVLQYLPFNVLPKPQSAMFSGNAKPFPMIVDHEIVTLTSASMMSVLRKQTAWRARPPKKVAVLADPVFDARDMRLLAINGLPGKISVNHEPTSSFLNTRSLIPGQYLNRLRATSKEALGIEGITSQSERLIATGFDANLQLATSSDLSQYQVIHFATHSLLDSNNPGLTSIVFSLFDKQGKPQNGHLRLNDIYNLTLPVELIVLSACETGLGKEFKGEGLVGLTRGFMHAGAPRVMASLWKVDDDPTAKLMQRFYWHLLKEGLRPAAALRQAQLDLWHSAEWSAPFHWGSFVLQGEWR